MDFAAFIPCYSGGNAVRAVKKDGQTEIIAKNIKTVIKTQMKERGLNFQYVREILSAQLRRSGTIPLPIEIGVVLIPIKVRKPIAVNDGAYAYVDISFIKAVSGGKNAVVSMTFDMDIKCIESAASVKAKIKMGEVVAEKFAGTMMKEWSIKEGIDLVNSEYNRMATKGDVAILAAEILKLRNAINK